MSLVSADDECSGGRAGGVRTAPQHEPRERYHHDNEKKKTNVPKTELLSCPVVTANCLTDRDGDIDLHGTDRDGEPPSINNPAPNAQAPGQPLLRD
ncbi:unnamed protein product [Danaus chrysippus]|uniref:(African queen) hypothetical protein n=1 Tax=Danaus chrysippus TaxID=151541 RepID=A0A8J2R1C7_9NEOP|nr:unnamed protein product [Danaus chrysippus]